MPTWHSHHPCCQHFTMTWRPLSALSQSGMWPVHARRPRDLCTWPGGLLCAVRGDREGWGGWWAGEGTEWCPNDVSVLTGAAVGAAFKRLHGIDLECRPESRRLVRRSFWEWNKNEGQLEMWYRCVCSYWNIPHMHLRTGCCHHNVLPVSFHLLYCLSNTTSSFSVVSWSVTNS